MDTQTLESHVRDNLATSITVEQYLEKTAKLINELKSKK
jgi:hypothetical protein